MCNQQLELTHSTAISVREPCIHARHERVHVRICIHYISRGKIRGSTERTKELAGGTMKRVRREFWKKWLRMKFWQISNEKEGRRIKRKKETEEVWENCVETENTGRPWRNTTIIIIIILITIIATAKFLLRITVRYRSLYTGANYFVDLARMDNSLRKEIKKGKKSKKKKKEKRGRKEKETTLEPRCVF